MLPRAIVCAWSPTMPDPDRTLRFDRFTLRPASGEIEGPEGTVRLEPQPAKVLAFLAERHGRVVSREELQRAVWPDGTFVDFERGLNYCVAKIRAALGDSATEPRLIETLPRRGYRFLVPVETSGPAPAFSEGIPERLEPGAPTRIPPTVVLAMVVSLLTVFGVMGWLWLRAEPTIAVARFDDETAAAAQGRLAQRLTDAAVEALARPPARWSVIGNAAILRTARSFRDLERIRAALGADLIVLGQVQDAPEAPGGLRVLVHLIRARDQRHLWANRFEARSEPDPRAALEAAVAEGLRQAVESRAGSFRFRP